MRLRFWSMLRSHKSARGIKQHASLPLRLEALESRFLLSANYVQTNLVSDIPGMAATTDSNLINPWGITYAAAGPIWSANNGTGTSTLYNGQGTALPLVVNIPGNNSAKGTPTGTVFNTVQGGFVVSEGQKSGSSVFLFDSLDGTISGWSPGVDPTNAVVGVTQPGAVFTGLAMATGAGGRTLLYAADTANGVIDVYDQNFTLVTNLKGNFTDPNLPSGFRPFNIQNVGDKLYVEYLSSNSGIVDVYNPNGLLDTQIGDGGRLITGGALDKPWGVTLAPTGFGTFSNDLLVGNFGNGNINAFNAQTGEFLGELTTSSGQAFSEDHLWSLQFGNGVAAGKKTTLIFTAGINGEKDGLLGSLQAEPTVANGSSILANLPVAARQNVTTVSSIGDLNPYGVAFVPQDFATGGTIQAGDLLVSNFNNSANTPATGSTIVAITPAGQQTTFFQGSSGDGLTTALGVLSQGFVVVGNTPATTQNGTPTVAQGSLLIIDKNGNQVGSITSASFLQGPWDLAVNDQGGSTAQLFVSNVLSGTVTRIDLTIPANGTPQVTDEVQIASGFAIANVGLPVLVVGPTGLAFDAQNGTLYVASTDDDAIFAIPNAATATSDQGTGTLVVQDTTHLHGPLGLTLAPNGNLIVANGDAVNASFTHFNFLTEYTTSGQFIAQYQLDNGPAGAAFGLTTQSFNNQIQLAAVDDDTNSVQVFTLDPH
jgi:uncharacterized protein (TIGR03118 family)